MARDTRTASLPFGPATEKLLAAPKKTKPPSRVQHRLIEAAASIVENDESELCFQHTVFCQTGLPYRDPGDAFPPCYGHRDRLRIAKGRGREITRSLARPPPAYEASRNLTAPETGRASGLCPHRRPQPPPLRPDLATRHPRQPGIDTRLRMIAQRDGLMIVEVLERALDAMNALDSAAG